MAREWEWHMDWLWKQKQTWASLMPIWAHLAVRGWHSQPFGEIVPDNIPDLRKVAKLGPWSMYEKLLHQWANEFSPREIYEKTRHFFYYYSVRNNDGWTSNATRRQVKLTTSSSNRSTDIRWLLWLPPVRLFRPILTSKAGFWLWNQITPSNTRPRIIGMTWDSSSVSFFFFMAVQRTNNRRSRSSLHMGV
jgi:hypothetical protein